jgi:hypothetical protein
MGLTYAARKSRLAGYHDALFVGPDNLVRAGRRGRAALLAGAAAVNSVCPAQPIGSIDGVPFPADDKLVSLLREAWESVPFDAL